MTDKKSSESRRKLLKSLAAGSGVVIAGKNLPESWTKPVVGSVMLPAHAQTSGPQLRNYFGGAVVQASIPHNENMLASVAGRFIDAAHAGVESGEERGTLCAEEQTDTYKITYQNNKDTVLRIGELPKNLDDGTLAYFDKSPNYSCTCCEDLSWLDNTARITEITDDYLELEIDNNRGLTLRVGISSSGCGAFPPLTGIGECT